MKCYRAGLLSLLSVGSLSGRTVSHTVFFGGLVLPPSEEEVILVPLKRLRGKRVRG